MPRSQYKSLSLHPTGESIGGQVKITMVPPHAAILSRFHRSLCYYPLEGHQLITLSATILLYNTLEINVCKPLLRLWNVSRRPNYIWLICLPLVVVLNNGLFSLLVNIFTVSSFKQCCLLILTKLSKHSSSSLLKQLCVMRCPKKLQFTQSWSTLHFHSKFPWILRIWQSSAPQCAACSAHYRTPI